jgi:hypothetical protein
LVLAITGAIPMKYKYNIALSFAGEDREYVEKVAVALRSNNVSVFYDKFEIADLWGKNLYDHLHKVYGLKSQYTVIFISEYYATKNWTNFEREVAQERAFKENREYVLPVRFDQTLIPGISDTTAYIDGETTTALKLSKIILKKLGRKWNDNEIYLDSSSFSLQEKTSFSELLVIISMMEESLHLLESTEEEYGLEDYEAFYRVFIPDFAIINKYRTHILNSIPESLSGPRDEMGDGIEPIGDVYDPVLTHRVFKYLSFWYDNIYHTIYGSYYTMNSLNPIKKHIAEMKRLIPSVRNYIYGVIGNN